MVDDVGDDVGAVSTLVTEVNVSDERLQKHRPDLMTSIDTLTECGCIDDVYDDVATYDVLPVLDTSTICADSVSYTDDTTMKSLMTH